MVSNYNDTYNIGDYVIIRNDLQCHTQYKVICGTDYVYEDMLCCQGKIAKVTAVSYLHNRFELDITGLGIAWNSAMVRPFSIYGKFKEFLKC